MSSSFDPMGCSLPGTTVHEISQARILEWVAPSFSRGPFQYTEGTLASSALQVDSLLLNHQGSLEINPHKDNQVIFDEEASEEIQCRKDSLFKNDAAKN